MENSSVHTSYVLPPHCGAEGGKRMPGYASKVSHRRREGVGGYVMKYFFVLLGCFASCAMATAQEVWSVDRCMAYAVENNNTVKQRELDVKNYRMDKLEAIGNFLPSVGVNTGFNMGFGRSIDPQTNTYVNNTNLNVSYGVSASLPIFQGGSLILTAKKANAALLLGKAALEEAEDNVAMETFDAYIQALYAYGSVQLARRTLADSDTLLMKTRREEELGLKSYADLVQSEAQRAQDEYNLTTQENAYETAMLDLRQKMNYPDDEPLMLDTAMLTDPYLTMRIDDFADTHDAVYAAALENNPTLKQLSLNMKIAKLNKNSVWHLLMPTIGVSGGVSSAYFADLNVGTNAMPQFAQMAKDNFGSSFGVSFSLPAIIGFNGFTNINQIRRAKNTYRAAQYQYEDNVRNMQKIIRQAVNDRKGAYLEMVQLEKLVEANRLAYSTVRREYEEGLKSSLDLRQSAATLLNSEMSLMQSRLKYVLKCRTVDYYKGGEIIRE